MICRRLLSILLVMLIAVSCDESTEIIRTQRNPFQKIQVTSLAKEPELERVLNVAGFYSAANGRTNDAGIEIDVNYVMKIVQADSIHHTFTFKLEDQEDHSFSNLIIEELGDGYLGYILKYQYEEIYAGMKAFTGSIKRIDLAGELIRTMNFVNGDVIGITEMGLSSGRQRQQAPQCVVNSETFTECAAWGYTFAHQTEAVCLEIVTVIVQELGDCPNADPFPSNPGPIPPAGGGTYIPTSGGSNPSPTPMDDPDVGNTIVPIPGYKPKRPVVVIPDDDEIAISVDDVLKEDPFALIDIDCDQLPKWQALTQHVLSQSIIEKLKTYSSLPQNIENAEGAFVNLDFFPVKVTTLPNKPGGGKYTATEFLNYIRINLNSFLDNDVSTFSPYNDLIEKPIWESANPLGALMRFDIPVGLGGLISQDGTVICSSYNTSDWMFTTVESPVDWDHPVSGHRQFGFETNSDGTYTFFVRGVDRVTENFDLWAAGVTYSNTPFEGGDALWKSFQNKLQAFINNPVNGGASQKLSPVMHRPDWEKVKDVLNGSKPISDLGCK